jgi:hypothetical protein
LIDFLDSPAAAGVLTVRLGFVEKVLALLHGHARTLCLVWIPDRRTGNCCLYLVGRIRPILHDLCHQDGWHGGLVLDLSLKSPEVAWASLRQPSIKIIASLSPW